MPLVSVAEKYVQDIIHYTYIILHYYFTKHLSRILPGLFK